MRKTIASLCFAASVLTGAASAQVAPQPTAEAAAQAWCSAFDSAGTFEEAATALYGWVPTQRDVLPGSLEDSFVAYHSDTRGCIANLKNIATACEMYSTDNSGRYPETIAQLVPEYLKRIPECPAANADTYSASYQTGPDAPENSDGYQDYYLIYCQGHHHQNSALAVDSPAYNGIWGLFRERAEEGAPLPRAQRTCKVVSIEPDGDFAIARVSEMLRSDLDGAPETYDTVLYLKKTRAGWTVAAPELSEVKRQAVQIALAEIVLNSFYLSLPVVRSDVQFSPLERVMALAMLDMEPTVGLMQGRHELLNQAVGSHTDLEQVAHYCHRYYEETGRWPTTLADIIPVSHLPRWEQDYSGLAFRPSGDGKMLELTLPSKGIAEFDVPPNYPMARLLVGGRTRYIYRPEP